MFGAFGAFSQRVQLRLEFGAGGHRTVKAGAVEHSLRMLASRLWVLASIGAVGVHVGVDAPNFDHEDLVREVLEERLVHEEQSLCRRRRCRTVSPAVVLRGRCGRRGGRGGVGAAPDEHLLEARVAVAGERHLLTPERALVAEEREAQPHRSVARAQAADVLDGEPHEERAAEQRSRLLHAGLLANRAPRLVRRVRAEAQLT